MKKQINHSTEAYLIRGAFYLLLLIAVCAVPLALAQQKTKRSAAKDEPNSTRATDKARVLNGGLNPALSAWTIVAKYPLVIQSPAVASDGTYAYSGTGSAGDSPTSGFYRYDPVGDTWTSLPNVPIAVYAAGAVYAGNTNAIYIFGGYDGTAAQSTTQIYNIATQSWSTGAPMPEGRSFVNAAYYPDNGKIYVIGGFDTELF